MLGIQKPQIKVIDVSEREKIFEIEPLERGFGHTLGNSIRRILLSSIPGAAVTSVKIAGVQHEYSAIEGVKEDTIEILLNIKSLVLKVTDDEPVHMKLKATKPGEVKASDIEAPSTVEIINTDHHIATITKKGKQLELEMIAEKGRGYVPAEEIERKDMPISVIPLDAIFSPVRNVSFQVESTRVGQRTDFDKLALKVETDGSIKPDEAVSIGAAILIEHIDLLADVAARGREEEIFEEPAPQPQTELTMKITDLDLSVRAYNCLRRAKIESVADLLEHTEEELLGIRNLGAKTVELIKERLKERGLSLKESL